MTNAEKELKDWALEKHNLGVKIVRGSYWSDFESLTPSQKNPSSGTVHFYIGVKPEGADYREDNRVKYYLHGEEIEVESHIYLPTALYGYERDGIRVAQAKDNSRVFFTLQFAQMDDMKFVCSLVQDIIGVHRGRMPRLVNATTIKEMIEAPLRSNLIELEARTNNARSNILDLEQRLIDAHRASVKDAHLLEKTSEELDKIGEKSQRIFSEIEKLNLELTATDNGLIATTPPVTLNDGNDDYEMGKYEIKLTSGGITFKPLETNDANQGGHPHLSGDSPCWGNLAPEIAKLRTEGEIGLLLGLCLSFINSYNPNDAYWQLGDYEEEIEPDDYNPEW